MSTVFDKEPPSLKFTAQVDRVMDSNLGKHLVIINKMLASFKYEESEAR